MQLGFVIVVALTFGLWSSFRRSDGRQCACLMEPFVLPKDRGTRLTAFFRPNFHLFDLAANMTGDVTVLK